MVNEHHVEHLWSFHLEYSRCKNFILKNLLISTLSFIEVSRKKFPDTLINKIKDVWVDLEMNKNMELKFGKVWITTESI